MINVLKYRWVAVLFSVSLTLAFIGTAAYRYYTYGQAFSYSVDFTGGAQVLFSFDKPVSALELKELLEKNNWQGVATREFSQSEILVRVKNVTNDAAGVGQKIQNDIQANLPGTTATILQTDIVGPGVGSSLRDKSIKAVLIALIAMLSYIALRFWSVGFAVGAVVALFHDAMVMLAAFLFFNQEISINLIGAVLAILGYSINDTIVIFSQIRDNLKRMSHAPLPDIINTSINQTLRRTMLTSISTGLVVLAMLFLGGEVLRDFSFALLIGIVFGTYSSIYIASPVMMLFYKKD